MKQEIGQITAGIRRKRLEHQLKKMLPDLYRSALSLCHSPATAEDLVHDTCVKAIVSCDKPDSEKITANHAWLKKILLNTLLLTAITLALIALTQPGRHYATPPGHETDRTRLLVAI